MGPESDPRYREAMAHLQAGEWQEAIDAFGTLRREYPTHRGIRQALGEARFKASLDAQAKVKARRWAIPWRSLIVGSLIVVLTVTIGFMVTQIVTRQVLPALAEARAQREQAELLAEGQSLLEAGALDAAQARFAELLNLVPGHPEALQGLERIAEQRVLEDLYQQAVAFQESGSFGEAHRLYSEILRRSSGYRDVEERLETVSRRQELEDLFAQAGEAYEAGQAREALSLYETVRQRNVSYESDLVEARLFELYMRVGRQIVDQPRDEDLPQALRHFARALSLRPSNSSAAREHHLAITCAEGFTAYDDGVWGRAIGRLRIVFDERPDYLGGIVARRLYLAYVNLGEQYEAAGNLQLAYEQYQKALELPVDRTLAEDRATALAPMLTPTPRPTPLPTGTPAAAGSPPFRGTEVQDENLLTNPGFEGGWRDIYTGQAPEGWRVLWLDGVEFPGSADIALAPETIVQQQVRTPQHEWDLLFLDGSQSLKVFKGFAPVYAALAQDVTGLDVGRRYRLVAPVFVDTYLWDSGKVQPGGESARVRLGVAPPGAPWRDEAAIDYSEWWDGTNTSDFFFQYSEFTFDFEATEPDVTIYIEMAAIYGLPNNGFFIDAVALHPLGTRSP